MTGGIEMKLTKGKKIAAVIAVVIVVIAVISVLCGIVYYGVKRSKYNNVVEMIKQGNYETAEEMLIDMNVIGTKNDEKMADFRFRSVVSCEHLEIENAEHYFVDSAVLYVYISAMEYYNDNKFEYAKNRINLLPEDYSGDLCEEIKTSKQEINKRYEEYQQEMKKSKEEYINELRQLSEKESQEKRKKREEETIPYPDRLPFEGMKEFYIDCTKLGAPDKYERTKKNNATDEEVYDIIDEFIWYDKGYLVTCKNGTVTNVKNLSSDYLKEHYDGYRVLSFRHSVITADLSSREIRLKNSSSSSSHSSSSPHLYGYSHGDSNHCSDKYNVYDYDDPEDFYYDNEDDFDGVEDAETYFYDHND